MASATPEWGDLVGKPFKLGARGPDAYDCYGLVMEYARRSGVELPDIASPDHIAKVVDVMGPYQLVWTPSKPVPGAIVALRTGMGDTRISHVGILLPYEHLLHVWERSGGVCGEPLSNWRRRVAGFYELSAPK